MTTRFRSAFVLRGLPVAAAFLGLLAGGSHAHADLIVDQQNPSPGGNGSQIQAFSPVGQEFTPTLTSVDWVELQTQDFFAGDGLGADLIVRIRDDTIGGTILGTSQTTSMPSGTPFGTTTFFSFASAVSLTPGNRYVIEVAVTSGGPWGVHSSGNTYSGGRAIFSGSPSGGEDLNFREGITVAAVPAPGGVVLGAVGAVSLLGYARRRRAAKPDRT